MATVQNIVSHFSTKTRKILSRKFLIIAGILFLYFLFASWHFGLKDGFLVMILSWSFFVLATPIPDGGLILDLPIRYFIGIRMVYSEMMVWVFAISLNVMNLIFNKAIYEKTILLTLFRDIMLEPIPYGLIILLSCVGTFFSLYFGDELYEVISHKDRERYKKHHMTFKLIIMLSLIIFIVIIYELLLKHLGIQF